MRIKAHVDETDPIVFLRSAPRFLLGIDLMNTAYNYLDLRPNGGDEGGR